MVFPAVETIPPRYTRAKFNAQIAPVLNDYIARRWSKGATYTIHIGATTYELLDVNNVVVSSHADAAVVINLALATLAAAGDSGCIEFEAGYYICYSTISANLNGVTFKGQGEGVTVIYLADGTDDDLLTVGTVGVFHSGFNLYDITLDGNKANNTAGNCLILNSIYRARIINSEIFNASENNVVTNGALGFTTYDLFIVNSKISYADGSGFKPAWCSDSYIVNCLLGGNGGWTAGGVLSVAGTANIYLDTTGTIYVLDSHIWGGYDGIYMAHSTKILIENNDIEDNAHWGIKDFQSSELTISGNQFRKNLLFGDVLLDGSTKINWDWDSNILLSTNKIATVNSATFYRYRGVVHNPVGHELVDHHIWCKPNRLIVSCSAGAWIVSGWIKDDAQFQLYVYKMDGQFDVLNNPTTLSTGTEGITIYYEVSWEEYPLIV